jgi:hypothetical protein
MMNLCEVVAMAGLAEAAVALVAALEGMRGRGEPRWTRLDWWALAFGVAVIVVIRMVGG